MSPQLNLKSLEAALPSWRIIYLEQVDSTNRYASAHARDLSLPAVVVAEEQSAGRGRGSNRWWSAPGGLTFSLVIRASQYQIARREQGLLSLLTAAVLRQSLCDARIARPDQLQLKWPNDLYLNQRKVCGILLEQAVSDTDCLVIGIGLNVNNSWNTAPEDLRDRGIALCDVAGAACSRERILIEFARLFSQLLEEPDMGRQCLVTAWRAAHLLDGKIVSLEQSGELLVGRCEGIDEDGALLLRQVQGLCRIHSATILGWEG